MIQAKGNRDLYNKQFHLQPDAFMINEQLIIGLLESIHRHKKVLEQEYLMTLKRQLFQELEHVEDDKKKTPFDLILFVNCEYIIKINNIDIL